jgi:DNA-binding NtrC family response regulator
MTSRLRSVLVVEDEPDLQALIGECLETEGFAVARALDAADAIERLRGFAYDGVVVDLRLPDANGMDVLDEALTLYPEIRAIVITGFGGVSEAVTAIKRGAIDFLIKPFQLTQLARVLRAAIDQQQLRHENAELRKQLQGRFQFDNIIGRSAAMSSVFGTLELVAPMNSTVLIQGETGTGKELVARTVHHNSPRRDQPFVAFNAAAIPEGLAEAELFGHVKGAFTGAIERRTGRFELADHGTLFLDEVGELPLETQVKLLRVLQEGEFEPVGSSRTVRTDVRIIAATNRNLDEAAREGRFRSDLFYRLNVFPVYIPPLRERRSDIPQLVLFFLARFAKKLGKRLDGVSQETMEQLIQYPWPGNVRELQNVIERAVVLAQGTVLTLDQGVLHAHPLTGPVTARLSTTSRPATTRKVSPDSTPTLEEIERQHILTILEQSRWVIEGAKGAARLLDLHPNTLRSRMKKLGIHRPSPESL